MRKLSLDLDALTVDSFETGAELRGAGTVRGHVETRTPLEPIPIRPQTWERTCTTCTITGDFTCATCDEPSCMTCHTCLSGAEICCA